MDAQFKTAKVVQPNGGMLLSHKKEQNPESRYNMGEPRKRHAE